MQLLEIPSITPDLLLEELVLSEAVVVLTQAAINETLLMPEMTDGNPSGPQPGGKGRERPQGPNRPPSRP
jgi:hypothetical protein